MKKYAAVRRLIRLCGRNVKLVMEATGEIKNVRAVIQPLRYRNLSLIHISKLSIPPFLLGLSWSTTERMSAQQADILTSELEAYRRILNPVIGKVCSLWLRLHGYSPEHTVVWDDINLQDAVELSNARLLEARAKQIEQELEPEREPEAPLEGGTQ